MKVFITTFVLSIGLLVGGFLCPPIGVIDGSVLSAVGLLLLFAVIEQIPAAIRAGKSLRVTKGDLEVTLDEASPPTLSRREGVR